MYVAAHFGNGINGDESVDFLTLLPDFRRQLRGRRVPSKRRIMFSSKKGNSVLLPRWKGRMQLNKETALSSPLEMPSHPHWSPQRQWRDTQQQHQTQHQRRRFPICSCQHCQRFQEHRNPRPRADQASPPRVTSQKPKALINQKLLLRQRVSASLQSRTRLLLWAAAPSPALDNPRGSNRGRGSTWASVGINRWVWKSGGSFETPVENCAFQGFNFTGHCFYLLAFLGSLVLICFLMLWMD